MVNKIGVPVAQGLDVPNFVNDIPRLPKSIPSWGTTSNQFPNILIGMNEPWVINRGPGSSRIGCTKFCKRCAKVAKVCSEVENNI